MSESMEQSIAEQKRAVLLENRVPSASRVIKESLVLSEPY